jgi:hypothetical protein
LGQSAVTAWRTIVHRAVRPAATRDNTEAAATRTFVDMWSRALTRRSSTLASRKTRAHVDSANSAVWARNRLLNAAPRA